MITNAKIRNAIKLFIVVIMAGVLVVMCLIAKRATGPGGSMPLYIVALNVEYDRENIGIIQLKIQSTKEVGLDIDTGIVVIESSYDSPFGIDNEDSYWVEADTSISAIDSIMEDSAGFIALHKEYYANSSDVRNVLLFSHHSKQRVRIIKIPIRFACNKRTCCARITVIISGNNGLHEQYFEQVQLTKNTFE